MPAAGRGDRRCCRTLCGCYKVLDPRGYPRQKPFTEDQINADIKRNLDTMTMMEVKALLDFSEDRTSFSSPYSGIYDHDDDVAHNKVSKDYDFYYKILFSYSLLQSRCWVNDWKWDFIYFSIQQHPLFGFWAHSSHPLTRADRMLVVLAGFCICLINHVIAPLCYDDICSNTCFSLFIDNGVCEDGGNFTWAGTHSIFSDNVTGGPFPCDFGTDCSDCGPRDIAVWRTHEVWRSNHPDGGGYWCFSQLQLYLKFTMMVFVAIPAVFISVRQLILCKCCIRETNARKRRDWSQAGRVGANFLLVLLCIVAGYRVKYAVDHHDYTDGISLAVIITDKIVVYVLVAALNLPLFLFQYRLEKLEIYKYRGMSNYIKARMSLKGIYHDFHKRSDSSFGFPSEKRDTKRKSKKGMQMEGIELQAIELSPIGGEQEQHDSGDDYEDDMSDYEDNEQGLLLSSLDNY